MGDKFSEKDKKITIALLRKIQDDATEKHERSTAKKLLLKRLKKYNWTYEEFISYQDRYGERDERIADLFSDFDGARKRRRENRTKKTARPFTKEEKEEIARLTKEFLGTIGTLKKSLLRTFFQVTLIMFVAASIACAAFIL